MLFKTLFNICFLGMLSFAIQAQTIQGLKINSIAFSGAKKNKVSFLKQFLKSKENNLLATTDLDSDIQELKNIAGIGNATYSVDTNFTSVAITFTIEEVKTRLPIVNFGGIEGNIWYQLGFSDINWKGKGQFLSLAYFNNDRRHGGQFYFKAPRIKGSPWGYSISLLRWASREPLFFPEGTVYYAYDNNSIGLSGIRHLSQNKTIELGGTFFVEKYAKSEVQELINPPGPNALTQPKFLSKIIYEENFLNYHLFYLNGYKWKLSLQDVYNTIDKSWFHSLQFQGKFYSRLGSKGNLAIRATLGLATNNDSPFAPFVVDSHVNIRGSGNRIDRGTAQIVVNIEYRQAILESSNWGAQVVAFSDFGTWRNPGGELKDLFNKNAFRQHIGGGLRIIYQKVYGAVLRIDYGIDIFNKNQHGLVIGLGQYF